MSDELFNTTHVDPTLEAARRALELKEGNRGASRRLGASAVGNDCVRASYYSFRWASPVVIDSRGLMTINDGHRGELVIAAMLRDVPDLELWTEGEPGKQIAFELCDGHFVGKLDGVVLGLIQAPKTPHVWEAKVVNQKKFDKLKKLIDEKGEKQALENWDSTYFAQAQMYMKGMTLTRHYLTVASPGVRDIVGVRTEFQKDKAELLDARAHRIIFDNVIPAKISIDAAFWGCKYCDHQNVCHGSSIPQINCRTCDFAIAAPGGKWWCRHHNQEVTYEMQRLGCLKHRFNPHLINGNLLAENDVGERVYRMNDGSGFRDGNKHNRPLTPVESAPQSLTGMEYCPGCGFVFDNENRHDNGFCPHCSCRVVRGV